VLELPAEDTFIQEIRKAILADEFFTWDESKSLTTADEVVRQNSVWLKSIAATKRHTAAESRTDFAAIKDIYDTDAVTLANKLRAYIAEARNSLVNLVERQAQSGPLSAEFAQSIKVSTGPEFAKDVEAYLMDVWRRNRDAAIAELPERIKGKLLTMKKYAEENYAFCPTGEGGGIDNSCSPTGEPGKADDQQENARAWIKNAVDSSQFPVKQKNGKWTVLQTRTRDISRFQGRESVIVFTEIQDAGQVQSYKRLKLMLQNAFDGYKHVNPAAHAPDIFRDGVEIDKEFADWLGLKYGRAWTPTSMNALMRPGAKITRAEALNISQDILVNAEASRTEKYAVAFRPDVAGNYFHNRALLIRGIVDDELTRDAKFSIFETLKGGRTMNEAMGDLRSIFEPWIGDPTKIEPSGLSDTEEDILKPYRLENIVRTESTTAVAQGRAAVADAAADYVVGFQHSSILDFRTTEVCQLADGITFKKDDPRAVKLQPPLHFNCRSIDTFVTSDDDVDWTSEEDLDAVVRLIQPEFK